MFRYSPTVSQSFNTPFQNEFLLSILKLIGNDDFFIFLSNARAPYYESNGKIHIINSTLEYTLI